MIMLCTELAEDNDFSSGKLKLVVYDILLPGLGTERERKKKILFYFLIFSFHSSERVRNKRNISGVIFQCRSILYKILR